ncbi:MAG: SBBP repeat-containing protein [PVC group bacterium]
MRGGREIKIRSLIITIVLILVFSGLFPVQAVELEYSTYLGGSDIDGTTNIGLVLDSLGRVYAAGYTQSVNFPTGNSYQAVFGGGAWDGFCTCLSSSGSALIYSTYLGGSSSDQGTAVAIDSLGRSFLTGYTQSKNFPTGNAYQAAYHQGGSENDVFVTCLSSSGSSLCYSTYLGGDDEDRSQAIAVSAAGRAFLSGYTASTNFPVKSPYQSTYNGGLYDAFAVILSSSGSTVYFSTYLGGSGTDRARSVALNSAGSLFLAGATNSANFPTVNPYQSSNAGNFDAFVTKITHVGSVALPWIRDYNGDGTSDIAIFRDSSGLWAVRG